MRIPACGCINLACRSAGELFHVVHNEIMLAPCGLQSGFYWSNRLAQVISFLWRLVSASRLGARTQSRGARPSQERLEKGTLFAFNMHAWRKAYSVPFCVLLKDCLCSCCGHGLVLSFKWISDNRLRKARRDLGCSLRPQSHCEPGRVHRLLFHTNATKSSCSRDHIEENNVFFFFFFN